MIHHCYNGKLLSVNLSSEEVDEERLPPDAFEKFIGGKGLGAYLLYRDLKASVDPLGPDNILLLMTGPLQGLNGPSVGRWSLITKSPLTGFFLDSHCGGPLGRELKRAGYDGLRIVGRAKKPTALVINDDSIQFEPASSLWGKGIVSVTHSLHETYGKDVAVYAIGPAGEKKVLFATASCEIAHQTGRGGAGAIMGSKSLKAIVISGSGKIEAADPDGLREVSKETVATWAKHATGFKDRGTGFLIEVANPLGQYPFRNWESGYYSKASGLDVYPAYEKYGRGNHQSCPHCIMRCTHAYATPNPDNPAEEVESTVEYETLGLLGGNLDIDDFQAVAKMNYLCDDLGLDTISAGSAIGFAMEAVERGLLNEERVGFPLRFGDSEAATRLIRSIAAREGIGELLSKGARNAGLSIGRGAENLVAHVKGLDSAAWDPRGRRGMGLSYATAEVGASHLRGWPATTDPPDTSALPLVDSMIRSRDDKILSDSLVVCHFTYRLPLSLSQKVRLLNAATGLSYDEAAILTFAKRVDTVTRMFNIREGATRSDDVLPAKFWQPQKSGPRVGMRAFVDEADFEACIDKYYETRGWDKQGGPTESTLKSLGLEGLARA